LPSPFFALILPRMSAKSAIVWTASLAMLFVSAPLAEDWPDYRGKDRLGLWNETGLVETFPPEGLPLVWRVPLNPGFSSPTIFNRRVFVTDMIYSEQQRLTGTERLLALDEGTGKILWTREWPADYAHAHVNLHEVDGPAAPVIADGDR